MISANLFFVFQKKQPQILKSKKAQLVASRKISKSDARSMGKEILYETAQVMNTYFHGFKEKLESLSDKRKRHVYSPRDIVYGCIFMFLFRYDSRNNFNNNLNEDVPLNQRNCNSAFSEVLMSKHNVFFKRGTKKKYPLMSKIGLSRSYWQPT